MSHAHNKASVAHHAMHHAQVGRIFTIIFMFSVIFTIIFYKLPRPLTQHSDPCTAHTPTVGALSSQHKHSVATTGHTQQLQPTMPSLVASG
jgi:hypothetical protein